MDWVMANWVEITAVVGGVVTIASIIVKWTPTQKDDAVLAKVMKILAFLSLNKK